MVRQVVVVFHRLKCRGFAVHPEMVDRYGPWEEELEGFEHAEPRAQDWDQRYGGVGSDDCVVMTKRCCAL